MILRADRTLGQARAHFEAVHTHVGYAVEVDTSRGDPDECAGLVAQALEAHRAPSRLAAPVRAAPVPVLTAGRRL